MWMLLHINLITGRNKAANIWVNKKRIFNAEMNKNLSLCKDVDIIFFIRSLYIQKNLNQPSKYACLQLLQAR